jgi:anti-anti-sigma factor
MPTTLLPDCQVKIYRKDQALLLLFSGMMRLPNCNDVTSIVMPLLKEDALASIYLDLGNLTELDSAGLGVLVGLHMTTRNRKVQLTMLSPTAYISKLFESTKLTTIFAILTGLEAETLRTEIAKECNLII